MVYSDLDEACAADLEASDQLDADHAAGFGQLDSFERTSTDQSEVAVRITDTEPEQTGHDIVVHPTDEPARQVVTARELVSLHHIDVGRALDEYREFGWVVLPVAVGVKHPVTGRGREPGLQRTAVSTVALMGDHPQARLAHRGGGEDRGRIVRRAVVHHNDLAVDTELVEGRSRALDHPPDRRCIVVTGKEHRHRRDIRICCPCVGRAPHGASTSRPTLAFPHSRSLRRDP